MAKLLALHGPNLNLLGQRETNIYSETTLEVINQQLIAQAKKANYTLSCVQSNSEYGLIESIHTAKNDEVTGIVLNAAALTHTSIALRDALLAVAIPFVEVHLSNVYQREYFRHHSYLTDIAIGVIMGFGANSYQLGLQAMINYLENK